MPTPGQLALIAAVTASGPTTVTPTAVPAAAAVPAPTVNTGVLPYVLPGTVGYLGDEGDLTVENQGAVNTVGAGTYEDIYFAGGVYCGGGGTYVFRNCVIEGKAASWLIFAYDTPGSNILLEDCTLRWKPGDALDSGGQAAVQNLQASAPVTVRRCDISGKADGMQGAGNWLVEDTYIHDLVWAGVIPNNTHNDGIQWFGGQPGTLTVRGCYFDVGAQFPYSNSALFFQGSEIAEVLIEDNYINGGGYSLYIQDGDFRVINNRFGPEHLFGEFTLEGTGHTILEWHDNRDASGNLIGTDVGGGSGVNPTVVGRTATVPTPTILGGTVTVPVTVVGRTATVPLPAIDNGEATEIAVTHLTAGISTSDPATTAVVSPTSGATLILAVTAANSTGPAADSISVTGLGGTWTQLATYPWASRRRTWLFECHNWTGSGALSINPGISAFQEIGWVLDQAVGLDPAGPVQAVVADGGGDNSSTSRTLTSGGTAGTGDATYSALSLESNTDMTPEAGWTALGQTTTGSLGVRRIETAWDADADLSCAWTWGGAANGNGGFIAILRAGVGSDQNVAAVTVARPSAVPTPTISATGRPTAPVVGRTAAVPPSLPVSGARPTPAAVGRLAVVPTPVGSVTFRANPTVVAAPAAVPTPTVAASGRPTPAVVARTATVGTAVPIQPAPVAVVGVVVVTPIPTILVTTFVPVGSPVGRTATVPTPTVGLITTVTPAVVARTATVPGPTIPVAAAAVAAVAAVPAPVVSAPLSTTVTVAAVAVASAVGGHPETPTVEVWDGTAWTGGVMKVWDGSNWLPGRLRVFDGTNWR